MCVRPQGKFRAIGVSNYEAHHLQELAARRPEVMPHVNQVGGWGQHRSKRGWHWSVAFGTHMLLAASVRMLPWALEAPGLHAAMHAAMAPVVPQDTCHVLRKAWHGMAWLSLAACTPAITAVTCTQFEVHPKHPCRELRALCAQMGELLLLLLHALALHSPTHACMLCGGVVEPASASADRRLTACMRNAPTTDMHVCAARRVACARRYRCGGVRQPGLRGAANKSHRAGSRPRLRQNTCTGTAPP